MRQAGGLDTVKLQRKILADKLAVLKNGTEEEQKAHAEAATALAAFDAAQAKKQRDDALAYTLARIGAVAALEEAQGKSSYQSQLNAKQLALKALEDAAKRGEESSAAAIKTKRGELDAFIAQHDAEVAEKKRAALVLAQQNELALLEKQGKDTLALRLAFAEQLLAVDTDGTEKARAQQDADFQAYLLLQEEYNQREKTQREAFREQAQQDEQNGREIERDFAKAAGDAASDAYVEGLGKSAKEADQKFDFGRAILTSWFGVKPEDVEQIKAAFNQAFAEIGQAVTGTVNQMLAAGIAEADAQLQAVQTRLQELDQQLSQASSQRATTQSALDAATGARKQYLLKRLEKERVAEQKIANEKAKAARQEQEAAKEKARLEKEQQKIAAASSIIEATLLAIQAAQTVVKIASRGFTGYDNIALGIAAAATIAASIYTVKNAAQQFESGTGALGSDGALL